MKMEKLLLVITVVFRLKGICYLNFFFQYRF